MDASPKGRVLLFRPDTILEVRKDVSLETPERLEEAINLLEDWVQKQTHFMRKDFSREYLERAVIASKGSVERAKEKLDKMCTIRTLMPEPFNVTDVKKDLAPLFEKLNFAIVPELTEDHQRVLMYQMLTSDFSNEDLHVAFKLCTVIGEYLKQSEYCKGFIFIADYRQVNNLLHIVTKVNPVLFNQMMKIFTDVYGLRIKKAFLLSESKSVERFLNFFKQFLSPKIADRIVVLKSHTELGQFISTDILPVEYGGQERSYRELMDDWLDLISLPECMALYNESKQFKSNEAYRRADEYNEAYMGMPGSFRALSVD